MTELKPINNEKYFTESDRTDFIKQYIIQFMATYTTGNYASATFGCYAGSQESKRKSRY